MGFRVCIDILIQARGMLRLEQHPKCLNQSIQTQETISYFFY